MKGTDPPTAWKVGYIRCDLEVRDHRHCPDTSPLPRRVLFRSSQGTNENPLAKHFMDRSLVGEEQQVASPGLVMPLRQLVPGSKAEPLGRLSLSFPALTSEEAEMMGNAESSIANAVKDYLCSSVKDKKTCMPKLDVQIVSNDEISKNNDERATRGLAEAKKVSLDATFDMFLVAPGNESPADRASAALIYTSVYSSVQELVRNIGTLPPAFQEALKSEMAIAGFDPAALEAIVSSVQTKRVQTAAEVPALAAAAAEMMAVAGTTSPNNGMGGSSTDKPPAISILQEYTGITPPSTYDSFLAKLLEHIDNAQSNKEPHTSEEPPPQQTAVSEESNTILVVGLGAIGGLILLVFVGSMTLMNRRRNSSKKEKCNNVDDRLSGKKRSMRQDYEHMPGMTPFGGLNEPKKYTEEATLMDERASDTSSVRLELANARKTLENVAEKRKRIADTAFGTGFSTAFERGVAPACVTIHNTQKSNYDRQSNDAIITIEKTPNRSENNDNDRVVRRQESATTGVGSNAASITSTGLSSSSDFVALSGISAEDRHSNHRTEVENRVKKELRKAAKRPASRKIIAEGKELTKGPSKRTSSKRTSSKRSSSKRRASAKSNVREGERELAIVPVRRPGSLVVTEREEVPRNNASLKSGV